MNKLSLIAGIVLATTAAIAQAGTQVLVDFENEDGLIIGLGESYNFGAGTLSADQPDPDKPRRFTVGQDDADLGENGLWGGAGNKFVSFDHIGGMTLNVLFRGWTPSGFSFDYSAYQELGSNTPAQISVGYYDAIGNLIGSLNETIDPAFGWDTYDLFQTTGYAGGNASIARISISGDGVVLDNLSFVPEPASSTLLLAGLGMLAGVARRRRTAD
ncbi:MAG: PEP-CTERM sorting domain-containing protein [Candidatus Accumulibacter necessarius]|uniref:PEP-CTERM sorting domain-containing protein n=1 Tax=Candidatus Accumulibacter necessarius TaxID=2954386 RepID=UPI002FC31FC9